VLESEAYLGASGPRTIFSVGTNSGKLIRAHSYFQQEDEILLPPGRYFKVIDKLSPVPDFHIIHLQEIQPPYQTLADPFDLSKLKHTLPEPTPVQNPPISHKIPEDNRTAAAIPEPTPVQNPPISHKIPENNRTTTPIPEPTPVQNPPISHKIRENSRTTTPIPEPTPIQNRPPSHKRQENNPTPTIIPEPLVPVTTPKGKLILSYYIQEVCYEPHLIGI
jgi:hypothetical protein